MVLNIVDWNCFGVSKIIVLKRKIENKIYVNVFVK